MRFYMRLWWHCSVVRVFCIHGSNCSTHLSNSLAGPARLRTLCAGLLLCSSACRRRCSCSVWDHTPSFARETCCRRQPAAVAVVLGQRAVRCAHLRRCWSGACMRVYHARVCAALAPHLTPPPPFPLPSQVKNVGAGRLELNYCVPLLQQVACVTMCAL